LGPPGAWGQPKPTKEHRVKAAFLYKFLLFVEFPEDAFEEEDSPIVIGVLGAESIGKLVAQLVREETVQGRPLKVERYDSVDTLPEPGACHVLFIGAAMKRQVPDVLKKLAKSSTMTVGETEGFARQGGQFNFYEEKGKARFEINPGAAKRAGIRLDPKLLNLARIVRGEDEEGG